MVRSNIAARLLMLLAGTLLVACGSGERGASSSEITAVLTESGLNPDAWTVSAGDEVTVTFENRGSKPHNWTVLGDRVASGDDLIAYIDQTGAVLAETGDVAPGESGTTTFRVDDPGAYQVVCTVPGHFRAGAQGTLTVQ